MLASLFLDRAIDRGTVVPSLCPRTKVSAGGNDRYMEGYELYRDTEFRGNFHSLSSSSDEFNSFGLRQFPKR